MISNRQLYTGAGFVFLRILKTICNRTNTDIQKTMTKMVELHIGITIKPGEQSRNYKCTWQQSKHLIFMLD